MLFPKKHEQISSGYAEALAMLQALKIVYAAKGRGNNTVKTVAVYSDSQPALTGIHSRFTSLSLVDLQNFASMDARSFECIIRKVLSCIYDLTVMGVHVELRWVPRDQVLGNKRADRLTRAARRIGDLLLGGAGYQRPGERFAAGVGWQWVPVQLEDGVENLRQIRLHYG